MEQRNIKWNDLNNALLASGFDTPGILRVIRQVGTSGLTWDRVNQGLTTLNIAPAKILRVLAYLPKTK